MANRNKWLCLDCGADTGRLGEHYFVHTYLWLKVVGSKVGMLCIGCLETRLGRKLNRADFPIVYINNLKDGAKSIRLVNRLGA